MKKIFLIGALLASAITYADELTPLMPADPIAYNKLRDFLINDDKKVFLDQGKSIIIGSNMVGPVTPAELYKDYERNELAANKIYKGKTVRLIGTAEEIGEDALGKPYI
ncbi:hypothetical protein [Pantoea sp. CCBC3-3-1]|uniref:OB-fold protein n=1 Tax=Pantoea sp. CCBC3-3-1 TaxID=2490851 RepID=UPI00143CDF32|nr:hypothetical protein [Pantoea sp. CCBC3-3-1]